MRRATAAAALLLVSAQAGLAVIAPSMIATDMEFVADVLPLVLLLAVPAAVALAVAPRLGDIAPSAMSMGVMVAVGVAMRLVWFGTPAPLEDDYLRYLWDGGVVAAGHNPYRLAPSDILRGGPHVAPLDALAEQAPFILARVNFPDLSTIYPATAQLAFAVAHRISPWSIEGLRVVFLAADGHSCAPHPPAMCGCGGRYIPVWGAHFDQ